MVLWCESGEKVKRRWLVVVMVEEVKGRELVGIKLFSEPSSWTEVKKFLRTWREEGARNSLKTLEGGKMLLSKKKRELGNEGQCWSSMLEAILHYQIICNT